MFPVGQRIFDYLLDGAFLDRRIKDCIGGIAPPFRFKTTSNAKSLKAALRHTARACRRFLFGFRSTEVFFLFSIPRENEAYVHHDKGKFDAQAQALNITKMDGGEYCCEHWL